MDAPTAYHRYGLRSDLTATVAYSDEPTAEDVAALIEVLDAQIAVLKRRAAPESVVLQS